MRIGIDGLNVGSELPYTVVSEVEANIVLLAQIPPQRQMVSESPSQLAIVKFALRSQLAVVESLFFGSGFPAKGQASLPSPPIFIGMKQMLFTFWVAR